MPVVSGRRLRFGASGRSLFVLGEALADREAMEEALYHHRRRGLVSGGRLSGDRRQDVS